MSIQDISFPQPEEVAAARVQRSRELAKARRQRHYNSHREQVIEKARQWQLENEEAHKAYQKHYYETVVKPKRRAAAAAKAALKADQS